MTRKSTRERVLEIEVINSKIIHLIFKTQKEMCKAMMRFNAYYECPKFKDSIFTTGEFKMWYCNRFGCFDFYITTEGFNIPSSVLDPFYKGLFNPLAHEEKRVLEIFNGRLDDFYVITTYKGCDSTIFTHELLHGLYNTNPDYRKQVDDEMAKHNLSTMFNWLKKQGYDTSVLNDEANSYIVADFNWLNENNVYFPIELQTSLFKIKNKFSI